MNIKKILTYSFLTSILLNGPIFANYPVDIANSLAEKWLIANHKTNPDLYNLEKTISREEFIKIAINLSKQPLNNSWKSSFKDVKSTDWSSKYIETALSHWYISKNEYFRPKAPITKIEALKILMNIANINKSSNKDWKVAYKEWAINSNLISSLENYDNNSSRSFIFETTNNILNKNISISKIEKTIEPKTNPIVNKSQPTTNTNYKKEIKVDTTTKAS